MNQEYTYTSVGGGGGNGGNGHSHYRRRSTHSPPTAVESVYQPVNNFNGPELQSVLQANFKAYAHRSRRFVDTAAPLTDPAGFTPVSAVAAGGSLGSSPSTTPANGPGSSGGSASISGRVRGKDLLGELSKSMLYLGRENKFHGNTAGSGSGNGSQGANGHHGHGHHGHHARPNTRQSG